MIQKDCPVDFIQVNENQVRLTALWVLILVTVSLFISPFPIFVFLLIDFGLRAFKQGKYSLLNKLSISAIQQFKIANRPIDQAPKRFAAKIGLLLSAIIAVSIFLEYTELVFILSLVFAGFAFLESFLGFCAGCYVYTFLQKLKILR